jgi:hypothetical protein
VVVRAAISNWFLKGADDCKDDGDQGMRALEK